jgi:hypothetical protein
MSDENQLTEPERVSPSDVTVPDLPMAPVWPPPQQDFRRPPTLPVWVTILLIVLAIALIGGGLGLILFTATVQYRGALHAQATTSARLTAQVRLAQDQATAAVLSTANANIYASATAQSGATATATAAVDSATATATALGDVLRQATSGTAALDDPLSDNTRNNNWDQTNNAVNGQCVFPGTGYHALAAQQGFFHPCFAEASNFSNFAFQVTMIIDSGKQGGIIFRANSTSTAFYLFYVDIDGRYSLDLYKSSTQATTLSSGFSAAITTGLKQSNQLAVVAYNSILYLYANQQFIASIADNTLRGGKIGVAALDLKNPTEVEYTNAQVWTISSSTVLTPTATQIATSTATTTTTATPTVTVTPTVTKTPTATSTP